VQTVARGGNCSYRRPYKQFVTIEIVQNNNTKDDRKIHGGDVQIISISEIYLFSS
jgi:hypothetical protein